MEFPKTTMITGGWKAENRHGKLPTGPKLEVRVDRTVVSALDEISPTTVPLSFEFSLLPEPQTR